jgi:hypothetical protein
MGIYVCMCVHNYREERDEKGMDYKSHITSMRDKSDYEGEIKFHYVSQKTSGLSVQSMAFLQSRKATFFRSATKSRSISKSSSTSRLLTDVKGLSVSLQKRYQFLYNLKQSILSHPRTVNLELDFFSGMTLCEYVCMHVCECFV